MHFLSEKMKSMLQSKQSDQFDTLRLNAFFQIPSSPFCEKRKEVENKEKNIDGLQTKLKRM